jgi:cobalt-zinc-cadmium efflux system protein
VDGLRLSGHHHHHHHHAPAPGADARWLATALALIVAFMGVEVAAGILAHSLALLSDAAHMLTDAASLALALAAARLAARPAGGSFTFGLGRAEIISAQVNGVALVALAAIIGWEAAHRLGNPPDVEGGWVIAVGSIGMLVNVAAAWALSRAERRSLNIEGARAHVLADLYGSVGAVLAGIAVLTLGWREADAVAALLVALLMLRSGFGLVQESGRVLLEAAPRELTPQRVGTEMVGMPGIVEVHDLHVWEVTSGFPALSAHVLVAEGDDCHDRRRQLEELLHERFGIAHVTLQMEHEHAERLLRIETPES